MSNVLSVSAYNTLTTEPIVKKICWKNKGHFFPKKSFVYQFLISYSFNRIMIVPVYTHVSSKLLSSIKRKIEYLTKQPLARFSRVNVF